MVVGAQNGFELSEEGGREVGGFWSGLFDLQGMARVGLSLPRTGFVGKSEFRGEKSGQVDPGLRSWSIWAEISLTLQISSS